jgi:hypothetical protein
VVLALGQMWIIILSWILFPVLASIVFVILTWIVFKISARIYLVIFAGKNVWLFSILKIFVIIEYQLNFHTWKGNL